jgi:hypothetical protein
MDRAVAPGGTRSRPRRSRILRPFSVALVLYGIAGIVLLGTSAALVARPLDDVDSLTLSLEDQRGQLTRTLREMETALDEAARAADSFDASLDQAQTSSHNAAALARNVGVTMRGISQSLQVVILGQQPFIGIAPSFDEAARQADALGTDLDAIGSSLGANAEGVDLTGEALGRVASRLDELTASLEEQGRIEVSSQALMTLRLGLYAMLAWLGMFALGCLVAGIALWRHLGRVRAMEEL